MVIAGVEDTIDVLADNHLYILVGTVNRGKIEVEEVR
jgi:hypothetical protein